MCICMEKWYSTLTSHTQVGGSCPASLGTGLWSEKLFQYRAIVGHLDATLVDHATMFTATCKSLFSNMKEKKKSKGENGMGAAMSYTRRIYFPFLLFTGKE